MHYTYKTKGTCSTQIDLDLEGNVLKHVTFTNGCNGNLKAISSLVEGLTVEEVEEKESENETDTEVAIFYAMEHQYEEIILYGGLGGRIDHELANLYLLIHREYPIILMNEQNRIQLLKEGHYKVKKDAYQYLSFLALCDSCISEENVAYPLSKQEISTKDIYTVSNEIIHEEADITIHKGKVLMIQTRDA